MKALQVIICDLVLTYNIIAKNIESPASPIGEFMHTATGSKQCYIIHLPALSLF
jgi:hypothetical protein